VTLSTLIIGSVVALVAIGAALFWMLQRFGTDATAHGEAIGFTVVGTRTSRNSSQDALERIRKGPQ
jgi:hypothetical protein